MWVNNNFFKYGFAILLVLLIAYLASSISFIFKPIFDFFTILFLPVLMAGILYYLFRPFVRFLLEKKFSRLWSIIIVYFIAVCLIVLISVYVVPFVIEQVTVLTEQPNIDAIKNATSSILKNPYLEDFVRTYLYKINEWISSNLVLTLTAITRFTVLLFITPFVLFYFLKDDENLYHFVIKNLPVEYQEEAKMILNDMDSVLSKFITGQAIVSLIMGCMLFIGYLIIGLNHAFILALFAALFFTIPILGSILALIPALLIGLSVSAFMGLKVLVVMLFCLWLEGNIISPQLMSQRLNIHPVILILILIASGALYGILGLLLATPLFAIIKVLIPDLIRIKNRTMKELSK